jgi:protein-disulfide isomerase
MKNRILLVALSAALLLTLFYVATKYYKSSEAEKIGFLAQKNARLFVPESAPKKGKAEGSVYLVEFLDPECESCRAFYPHVKQMMSDYEKDLTIVVRYAPFHKNSKFAVKVLEASRNQNRYWETLELLFKYQPQWASHHDPQPERIWEFLPEIGVDIDKIKRDMNDPEIEKRLNQDIEDGKKLGVKRTPTFFVNGKPLDEFGPQPLRNLIENEIGATQEEK